MSYNDRMPYNSAKRDRGDDNNGYGMPPAKRNLPPQQYGPPQTGRGPPAPYGAGYPGAAPKMQRSGSDEDPNFVKPSSVLLFTVYNPKYPITVDVMHTICSQNGQVNRIVIFRKNGVQAMVEYDLPEDAERAKEALNGADIYSGCCTLKVDWGKPQHLTVVKNDQDSWDYTNPNLGKETKNHPLLPDPKFGPGPPPYGGHPPHGPEGPMRRGPPPPGEYGYDGYRPPADPYGDPYRRPGPPGPERYPPPQEPYRDMYGGPPRGPPHHGGGPPPYRGGPPPGPRPPHPEYNDGGPDGAMMEQGAVLMVYGLNAEKMNCQRLFNLFCLYGNVVRIKFLKSKEGVAMIQMADYASCDRAYKSLNNCYLFGSKMILGFSKQAFIQDVPNPATLNDGSISFADYVGNRNNRFSTPEAAAKNRIQPAAKYLYFFNAPPGLTEDTIKQLFIDADVKPQTKCKVFPAKSERSSTGLLEWENKGDAIEALTIANHSPLPNPNGKNPYILKLCFSNAPIQEHPSRD